MCSSRLLAQEIDAMLTLEYLSRLLEQNREAANAKVKEFAIGDRHFAFTLGCRDEGIPAAGHSGTRRRGSWRRTAGGQQQKQGDPRYALHAPALLLRLSAVNRHWIQSASRMAQDHEHSHRSPSLKAVFNNFLTYDAPLTTKVGLFFRNNFHKLRSRSNCCGNHGQPGC